jgi:hypothetical protein
MPASSVGEGEDLSNKALRQGGGDGARVVLKSRCMVDGKSPWREVWGLWRVRADGLL